jgi:fatty acid desaturase
MNPVRRADPKDYFTPQEWRALTRRSDWLGLGMVAHAWALIAAASALFIAFPNPATYVAAVLVIGARQLGLAILMHEAAHGGLHKSHAVNDFVGEWLCAAPVGANLKRYRPYHLKHHRFTETNVDPDKPLSAPFPISPASFRRKAIRDLTGQTFFKQRLAPLAGLFRKHPAVSAASGAAPADVLGAAIPFIVFNTLMFAGLVLAGLWWVFPALWLVPMATWFPFVTRLRNIAEHACVTAGEDPITHARTTLASPLERLLIAPYWVHFHLEHHLFQYLPAYRLAAAHRLLTAKGHRPAMAVTTGYRAVLQEALTPA